jgi:4-amino-4-deoxy-L-arabinose transferase-like glycosyltransferase
MEKILARPVWQIKLLLALLGAVFFIPFLGNAHLFDWDEINFAEAAREMVVTGNYSTVTIDFQPFWEKPPLFLWMQAMSMKVFGINEFAARFPNAVCGILTLVLLFRYGRRFAGTTTGFLWAVLYLATLLPHFYFKSGIIDPWFNLFIFVGIAEFAQAADPSFSGKKWHSYALSGAAIGLAVMTKGPVGFLIFSGTLGIWWITRRFTLFFKVQHVVAFLVAFLAAGSFWFVVEIANGRSYIVKDFIEYQIRLFQTQDAGHGGPFFYHWIVLLFGCFPAAALFISGLPSHVKRDQKAPGFDRWMVILFWLVLVLFSIVKTKIVHYSSMCYFPLTYLAARELERLLKGEKKFSLPGKIAFWLTGVSIALLLLVFSQLETLKDSFDDWGLVNDEFGKATLQAEASWTGFEWLAGVLFLVGLVLFFLAIRRNSRWLLPGAALLAGGIGASAVLLAPNVEAYSQRAAIEFYQDHADEKCLIYPIGFKSYAHLFYANKQPGLVDYGTTSQALMEKLVNPGIPVYLVAKIQEAEKLRANSRLVELYRRNGFVFYQLTFVWDQDKVTEIPANPGETN